MSLKKIVNCLIVAFAILGITAEIYAVTYEPLPHWPNRRGFYYYLNKADYSQFLTSSMPYNVMIGYIVWDSLVKNAPIAGELDLAAEKLNLKSDTVGYLMKYWYILNEYDPLRFHRFQHWHDDQPIKYPHNGYEIVGSLYNYALLKDSRFVYVYPSYILHVSISEVGHIDTSNTKYPTNSKTIAYCQILDTLKGGTFLSSSQAIFYNGEHSGSSSGISVPLPTQSDIVFNYRNDWSRYEDGFTYKPLFDSTTGENWIKKNKEYIVFLEFLGMDNSPTKDYYELIPFPFRGSFSMYPIENGMVLDEANALGFGKIVPVDVFKQGIRNKINEIKTFGE